MLSANKSTPPTPVLDILTKLNADEWLHILQYLTPPQIAAMATLSNAFHALILNNAALIWARALRHVPHDALFSLLYKNPVVRTPLHDTPLQTVVSRYRDFSHRYPLRRLSVPDAPVLSFPEQMKSDAEIRNLFLIAPGMLLSYYEEKSSLKLWDTATDACLTTFSGHDGCTLGALLLPTKQLLTWSARNLKCWDINTGECIHTFSEHTLPVRKAVLLNDRQFASCSNDKTIKIWDIRTGDCVRTLTGHTGGILDLQRLSSSELVSSSWDGTLKVWDANQEKFLWTTTPPRHNMPIFTVLPLSNGVVASLTGPCLHIWHVTKGHVHPMNHPNALTILGATLLPQDQLVTWSLDGSITLCNTATKEMRELPRPDKGEHIVEAQLVSLDTLQLLLRTYTRIELLDITSGEHKLLCSLDANTGEAYTSMRYENETGKV